jgi:hypothetical protein
MGATGSALLNCELAVDTEKGSRCYVVDCSIGRPNSLYFCVSFQIIWRRFFHDIWRSGAARPVISQQVRTGTNRSRQISWKIARHLSWKVTFFFGVDFRNSSCFASHAKLGRSPFGPVAMNRQNLEEAASIACI